MVLAVSVCTYQGVDCGWPPACLALLLLRWAGSARLAGYACIDPERQVELRVRSMS